MKQLVYFITLIACSVFLNIHIIAQNRVELNTELMKSTFKIQGFDGSFGTAFILGKPMKNDAQNARYVLVTADHVLKEMKGDSAILFLRKKNKDGSYLKIPIKIGIRNKGRSIWVKHDSADVAALYVALPDFIDLNLLSIDLLGMDDIYKKIEIHPGDVFMCLGYPLGQESNDFGFPILRSGMLSSFPVIPTKIAKSFLLDVEIFKGNSGGPVYFVQSGRTYSGGLHVETIQFIAGLISQERLNITQISTPYKASVEAQQLGLAVVIPSIFIKETINKLP